MAPYIIRDATIGDMPGVMALIEELAVFEKEPDAVEITVEDLERDGFGEKPAFHCFVAEMEDNIAGIALVYPRYSTWKGIALHLEDLVVSRKYRGKGLGKALLSRVIEYGHELGVKRINWEVLDWNEPAIKFYEHNGARIIKEWNVVHLDEKGIANYVANLK
ncbi:GNAT family N-acetyltransferase [Sinomicrobium kalidii]|uniref:GNAT family N-acetyltransferase n=1 Tax=Sinomicrobium kalidii TaxID=2900738 RepID=UPI001E2CE3F9|nr:GNAT family N-acetyltransferase [Sinomicrobium kalidii]UGU17532.1 GNAT family N-acetyltransferase [Sinomicrobium kalidii]